MLSKTLMIIKVLSLYNYQHARTTIRMDERIDFPFKRRLKKMSKMNFDFYACKVNKMFVVGVNDCYL